MNKSFPLSLAQLASLAEQYPTPVYIYDEAAIRSNAQRLARAFGWIDGYRNYFAVKALPNPEILKILLDEGMGLDASSLAELELCEMAGAKPGDIIFTSNNTPIQEYKRAIELGATINLDDINHVDYLLSAGVELPELMSFRVNPGNQRSTAGNELIGHPEEAKYGIRLDQVIEGYKLLQAKGVKRFGLHTMIVSNELNAEGLVETAKMLFDIAADLHDQLGISLEFANIGGGFGIPYKPNDPELDIELISSKIEQLYKEMILDKAVKPLRIVSENGRYITGPYGYLITRVRHLKHTYKDYVGVDATMADLMRPGMYGAYHYISVSGKEDQPANHKYDVVGSLCENNDKFAIDRMLPELNPGDFVVIHDAGAHAHAMGFNYNGKLRPAELLLKPDGTIKQIRRAETLADLFTTLILHDS